MLWGARTSDWLTPPPPRKEASEPSVPSHPPVDSFAGCFFLPSRNSSKSSLCRSIRGD